LEEFSSTCHKLFIFSIVRLQCFRRRSKFEIKKSRKADFAYKIFGNGCNFSYYHILHIFLGINSIQGLEFVFLFDFVTFT
jgi:hypothetical protein